LSGRSVFLIFLRLPGGRQATEAYLKKLEWVDIDREKAPEIPPGTEVAFLRRMMLFDNRGVLRLTPITESLQLRVYDDVQNPAMYEFTLRRKALFADRAGGLHPVAADEIDYFGIASVGLESGSQKDPFETEPQQGSDRPAPVVMKSCSRCHGPGIHGFQSMFLQHYSHPALTAIENLDDQVRVTIEQAEKTYAWGLLQGLWEADSSR
jgi:hypothetical protein